MNTMNNRKISVVTGASGFVGSHLVDLLLEKGNEVRCITRKTSSLKWLENKDVKIFDCGLYDKEGLKQVLDGADYLYHVAGVVKAKKPEGYIKGNVETTKALFETLVELDSQIKRVVIVSSQTACGPSLDGTPVNEETKPHPITNYGRSKLAQEELAKSYMDKFPVSIVRPPAVYGERDTEIFLVFRTFKQGLLTLIGFDDKKLSLVHAADLVNGIYLVATEDAAVGQTYFIGSEKYYGWNEVGDEMAKSFGRNAIRLKLPHSIVYTFAGLAEFFSLFSSKAATFNIEKARDFVQAAWTCDVSKAKKEIGYSQNVSLAEGIKRTIAWYKEMKWF